MPKDEFDFEDPLELNGVALFTHEDTTNDMAEVFIEEFMRMGYNHKQILALFRNPQYLGPNLALQKRGEPFVRDLIAEVFTHWGRPVVWSDPGSSRCEEAHASNSENRNPKSEIDQSLVTSAATAEEDGGVTDPMGAPIPKLNP